MSFVRRDRLANQERHPMTQANDVPTRPEPGPGPADRDGPRAKAVESITRRSWALQSRGPLLDAAGVVLQRLPADVVLALDAKGLRLLAVDPANLAMCMWLEAIPAGPLVLLQPTLLEPREGLDGDQVLEFVIAHELAHVHLGHGRNPPDGDLAQKKLLLA